MATDLLLSPGSQVMMHGEQYEITHTLDLETVVGVDTTSGERMLLPISQLEPVPDGEAESVPEFHEATEAQWREARGKAEAIEPLLRMPNRKRADVERVAAKAGVNPVTIYRWIDRFLRTGTLAALLPEKKDGGFGKARISEDVERVIRHYIETVYCKRGKPTDSKAIKDIQNNCRRAGLPVPHANTIRRRLKRIPGRIKAKAGANKREIESYTATPGKFPHANFPLKVYQVDHTPMDLVVVDDVYRQPIGRPYLTVVIDVFSRMVAGFMISLEAPSALSVGLALVHAILPKENWLAERSLDYQWPIYGKPGTVHADNGPDFRCAAVTHACQNNLFDIEWRPVKKPHWGAHIERLLGTVAGELKTLPGATGANLKEREGRDPSGTAAMTLREIEYWTCDLLLGKYHNKRHGTLGTTPLRRFQEGIFGTETHPGRGLPPRPMDGRRLLIDFLPSVMRTVQPTGVTIDNVRYFSRSIQDWVGARDESGEKRKFRIHRDPRAISPVYFYDPDKDECIDVPYADLSRPVISLSELKAAQRIAAERGKAAVDEDAIFRAAESMRRREEEASEKTKRARRNRQRRRSGAESRQAFPTAKEPRRESRADDDPPIEPPRSTGPVTAYEIEEFDG